MKVFAASDPGLKRHNNQDAFLIDENLNLYIVADGMGGHAAGEMASEQAVKIIKEELSKANDEAQKLLTDENARLQMEKERIIQAIQLANTKIYELARDNPQYKGMGTTIVLLKLFNGNAIVNHVGDSRLYRINKDSITQITKDHSRIQELIDSQALTPEEAEHSPFKNIITRALGNSPEILVDSNTFRFLSSDLILLCSDGLTTVLNEKEIQRFAYQHAGDPKALCEALIERVKEKGAPDNVTIIALEGDKFAATVKEKPPEETQKIKNEVKKTELENATPVQKPAPKKEEKIITERKRKREKPEEVKAVAEPTAKDQITNYTPYVLIGFIVIGALAYFSIKNNNTYWVYYNPLDAKINSFKGKFFLWGKTPFESYSIGFDNLWLDTLRNQKIKEELRQGKTFKSQAEIKQFVAEVAVLLGKNHLNKFTEEQLKSAIFYFNKAMEFGYKDENLNALRGEAYYKLGNALMEKDRAEEALENYQIAYNLGYEQEKIGQKISGIKDLLAGIYYKKFLQRLEEKKFDQAQEALNKAESYGYDKLSIEKGKEALKNKKGAQK